CLGWETAFPALLASWFTKSLVVFDDADRFSLVVRLPGPLHRWVQRLERWTSRRSALHLVPGFTRYDWRHERMIALPNSPLREDIALAKANVPSRPDSRLVLYANGWIGETRGAPTFLEALNIALHNDLDVRLVIAGHVTGERASSLIRHPLVHFVGEITQSE